MRALPAFLVCLVLAGCLDAARAPSLAPHAGAAGVALPDESFYERTTTSRLPPAGPSPPPFHSLEEIEERLFSFALARPDLVSVEEIGRSLQDRAIFDVVVTNRAIPAEEKVATWIDAGHHANELAGIELALYTIDFLLANADSNATVARWLGALEMHFVPLVNPDGYVVQTRGNALGVNLNRNYDVDWGNPLGANNAVMGTLAHATGQPMPSVAVVAENAGNAPFSEPESRAIRDRLATLDGRLAVYLTQHTPTNGFIAPWSAFEAPFPIPPEHDAVFEAELAWVREHTQYKAGKAQWGNFSAGLPYSASGSSQDWAYATHGVAAFTLEVEIWYTSVTSEDYAERVYLTPYEGLLYWMHATLPIPLQILANAERFARWELPVEDPPLPDGIPPERPAFLDHCRAIPHDEAPFRPSDPFAACPLVQPQH